MTVPAFTTPLVICVAPNGARRSKADHPALPMTPDELAAEAVACADAGASMIHLHVRDDAGAHVLDAARYRTAWDAIREAVGERMLVQVTTEAVGRYTPEQQMAVVSTLQPDAVSLAVREIVPGTTAEATAAPFLARLSERGTLCQYILYDENDVLRFRLLKERGVVPSEGASVLFVLGRYAEGERSTPRALLPFLEAWGGEPMPWAVCAFGPLEAAAAGVACGLGGHVRVGFENNLTLPDGGTAPDNAALVAGVARMARGMGRPLADGPAARREMAQSKALV